MPVKLPINFPQYDTSLSLLQKRKIWNSFLDLQTYIEDYYIVHTKCLATEGKNDINAYIFLKDGSDLQNLSDKCKNDWNLDTSLINSFKNQFIIRGLPASLLKEIYSNDQTIHIGGSIKCFHSYAP